MMQYRCLLAQFFLLRVKHFSGHFVFYVATPKTWFGITAVAENKFVKLYMGEKRT
jgi:hypothetical protein